MKFHVSPPPKDEKELIEEAKTKGKETKFTGYKAFYKVLETNTVFVMHFENPRDGPPLKADFNFNLTNMEIDG